MKRFAISSLIIALPAIFGLTSCGLEKVATGTEPTAFLKSTHTDTSKHIERLPFEHSWRDPKVDITKYKNIVVRPVTTSYLKRNLWEESKSAYVPTRSRYLRRCEALANHFDKSLQKAFSSPVCIYYKTTDASQPNTLILEVALTEVRFAGGSPPPAKPGAEPTAPVLITGLPVCAFEARVRDAHTGKLISTASDRRSPEIKVLKPEKTISARPNERICDEWSKQLMEAANIELFPKVKRSWFSLF